ncbi:ABC transporter permease subunit [Candidatus Micrarchaeota archaeon]|nr:ABC transporter permease subunit [Candidatus Micrarchaeota archaeon]
MRIFHAVKKELLEIVHDRTLLSVLLAFPIFIMLFMGSSFGSIEIRGLPVGVVGPTNTTFSGVLLSDLNESSAFNLRHYGSEDIALEDFRNGQLRAVIVIPEDFEQSLKRGEGTEVRIKVDNSDIALQEAIIAAMGSVVQASSTNITRSYVSSAWDDLSELNSSASQLAGQINESRARMKETKEGLSGLKRNISSIDIERLDNSLTGATAQINGLKQQLAVQRNSTFTNDTGLFLENASLALNESIATVGDTHEKLSSQAQGLNQTLTTLEMSITALEVLKNETSDNTTAAALDANIGALTALKNNTGAQLADSREQITALEELNTTLYDFKAVLNSYALTLSDAKEGQEELYSELDSALDVMNASLGTAHEDVRQLRSLLSAVQETTENIGSTLDQVLAQTEDVNSLISSLQETVEAQTSKDPETIASPLSVKVENQYTRGSFVDFIMPRVMGVSLLFSCFLLASISLVKEKTRYTIVRLLMIPGAFANSVAAKLISITLISLGQVVMILLVGLLVFGVRPPPDPGMLVVGTAVSALVLSAIGLLIGFYARTESAAIQTSLLLGIPMLFLGNIIFSPDLLPGYTQILQQLLPLAHITNIFKVVLITNGDPAADLAALLSYFALLALGIALVVYKKRSINNYV